MSPSPTFQLEARAALVAAQLGAAALSGCGGEPAARLQPDPRPPVSPFAVEIVAFEPGPGAGFGQELLPDVVLGPPDGGTTSKGGTDVLSLGQGGGVVLRLDAPLVDGPGPDLIVFENPFLVATGGVWSEPGEVSVSDDGETWATFPCDPSTPAPNGCAGYEPVIAGSANDIDPTSPPECGGDLFDLAWLDELGDAPRAVRFLRIVDRGTSAVAPTAGFDLDAIAVVSR